MSHDPRVEAIRADETVGTGSCSVIDETMTDEELIEALDQAHCWKPRSALRWARRRHAIWADRMSEEW